MGGLTMFGKTYDTVGSSDSNLLLKTRGDIKIQWGGKYIDLIKDGKINTSCDIKFKIINKESDIYKDGLYIIKGEENDTVIACIEGQIITLSGDGTTYVSFMNKQEATPDQKYQALQNIGFIYDTFEEAEKAGLTKGIIYVQDRQKLYFIIDGQLTELTLSNTTNDFNVGDILTVGSIIINGIDSSLTFDESFRIFAGNDHVATYESHNLVLHRDVTIDNHSRLVSEDFISGEQGEGYVIHIDNNESYLEIDNLLVRKKFVDASLNPTKVSYTELYGLIENNQLIKNNKYIITDFQNEWELGMDTTTYKALIVEAIDTNQISTLATYQNFPNWKLEYDVNYRVLVDKNTETFTKGRISKLTDEYNNSCNFDFKHLKFYINNDFNIHHGFYLFSRTLTEQEKKTIQDIQASPDHIVIDQSGPISRYDNDEEIYKDASLDGRYNNININLDRPKLYSPFFKRYILVNNELTMDAIQKDSENPAAITYDDDRITQVIFIREPLDIDIFKSSDREQVCRKERESYLLTMSEKDLQANETLVETLNKLELGLNLYNININNINGEFIFRYDMYNTSILGTLHQKDKSVATIEEQTIEKYKYKRIAADGTEINLEFPPSQINGRICNTTINGDIIGFITKEKCFIQGCTFQNIQDVTFDSYTFENNIFNSDIISINVKDTWRNNIFNDLISGKSYFPIADIDRNEFDPNEYIEQYGELTKNTKDQLNGIITDSIFNGPVYNLQIDNTLHIINSKFSEIRNVKITCADTQIKIIELSTFNAPISDLKINNVIYLSTFEEPIIGYKKMIDRLEQNKEYRSVWNGKLVKCQFNNIIIGFNTNSNTQIESSVFNEIEGFNIEALSDEITIFNSTFEKSIYGDFTLTGHIYNTVFRDDIIQAQWFKNELTIFNIEGNIENCEFYSQIIGLCLVPQSKLSYSLFHLIEFLKIGNEVYSLDAKKLVNNVEILEKCSNIIFYDIVKDSKFNGELSRINFYGTITKLIAEKIDNSSFEKIYVSTNTNINFKQAITNCTINGDIIDSDLENLANSIYYENIQKSQLTSIKNSQFYGGIQESTLNGIVGCLFNDIINTSTITNNTNCQFYNTIIESNIIECNNIRVNGKILKGSINSCIDCQFYGLSDITLNELTRVTINDDITGTILANSDKAEIDAMQQQDGSKDGYVIKGKLKILISGGFTKGMIMMWGLTSDIPKGWAICDGTNGTPNLIGKFVKASSEVKDIDSSHLANPDNNEISIEEKHLPEHHHPHKAHNHNGEVSPVSVSIEYSGELSGTGSLEWHDYNWGSSSVKQGEGDSATVGGSSTQGGSVNWSGGNHTHSASVSGGILSLDSATSEEDTKTWQHANIKIEPKAYALIFIMKL